MSPQLITPQQHLQPPTSPIGGNHLLQFHNPHQNFTGQPSHIMGAAETHDKLSNAPNQYVELFIV